MLINEFIERKKAVYYMAVEGTKKENLTGLSKAFLQDSLAPLSQFGDYEDLLAYIDQLALTGERYIIAIDEFPYLAASYPVISSLLQKHIDHCWKNSNLFLILCGSSMSFMEEQVLGYKSPLYGRRKSIHLHFLKQGRCWQRLLPRNRLFYMALQVAFLNIFPGLIHVFHWIKTL